MARKSFLAEGNKALMLKQFGSAMTLYLQTVQNIPELNDIIADNMRFAAQCFRTDDSISQALRVAVCSLNLAGNLTDRTYNLAALYEKFANVEIISTFFLEEKNTVLSQNLKDSFPMHSLRVDGERSYIEQAVEFVAARPYALVHISKPLMPNILLGMLYKLIWGTGVIVDLDGDDELTTILSAKKGIVSPTTNMKTLVFEPLDLTGKQCTDMAVNLVSEFDGITVANSLLQEYFGGTIILDGSDEGHSTKGPELSLTKKTSAMNASRLRAVCPSINRKIHEYEQRFATFLSSFGNLPRVFLSTEAQAIRTTGIHEAREGAEARENSRIFQQKLKSLEKSPDYSLDFAKNLKENEQNIVNVLEERLSKYQPLISVIMPNYNRADIITESILSVLEQSYVHFELIICDDGSTDNSREVIESLKDARIRYLYQENRGAAAARNYALTYASGELITYLDTDNYWHPEYLNLVVAHFSRYPGRSAMYFDYIDFHVDKNYVIHIKSTGRPDFVHESLIRKPFIDLNTFAHKRELYDLFGGFDETLTRRQDYDVMLKYTWLRDPLHIKLMVGLYQRNDLLKQITQTCGKDMRCVPIINRKIDRYFNYGLPVVQSLPIKKVTVIICDSCLSQCSHAFTVAEALARKYDVELIAFDFSDEGVFDALKDVNRGFEIKYFNGSNFPDFFETLKAVVDMVTGDIVYVVKPCLPSLGPALIVNYQRGIPFILEINELETVRESSPKEQDEYQEKCLENLELCNKDLLNPYSGLWSQLLDPMSKQIPVLVTHNKRLDEHLGNSTICIPNLKDERIYNPGLYDCDRIREELGFKGEDRIILFSGLLRNHKDIYELVELVERLGDTRYKLLFVGSKSSPDQTQLLERFKEIITVLPSQDQEGMARINYAADLVILWLNPEVAAGHLQMPYKAIEAMAMKTPLITNDISDLGDLGRQGCLKIVPFGDWQGMISTIDDLFTDPVQTKQMCDAARRSYLRQFSYNAGITCFELATYRAVHHGCESYPVANYFARHINRFYQVVAKTEDDYLLPHSR